MVFNGLTNGTPYTFTVHARHSVGNSLESTASIPVTPTSAPGAPTGVSAITGYTVTSTPGSLTCTSSVPPTAWSPA